MNEKNVPNIQLLSEEILFQDILRHKDAMAYLGALSETNPSPWTLRSQLPGLTSLGPLEITDPLRMNSSLHQKDWPLQLFCMLNNGFMHKAYGTFSGSVFCGYAKIKSLFSPWEMLHKNSGQMV